MWVSITKLLVKDPVHGEEDAENAKDYLAMHVYKTNKVGEPTYSAGSPLVKSTYRNDQTIMLYVTEFEADQFVNNP